MEGQALTPVPEGMVRAKGVCARWSPGDRGPWRRLAAGGSGEGTGHFLGRVVG